MSLRERKQLRKKEEILRAAADVFVEKGYHGTTMEDIAAKLLMTKGSVYYYFKDKQDLLYQCQVMLLEKGNASLREILESELSAKEKLSKFILWHIESMIDERSGFALIIRPDHFFTEEQEANILKLREDYAGCFDAVIEEGVKSHIFITSDIKIVRNLILGAMNGIVHWYSAYGKKDKHEFSQLIADYLLKIVQT